MKNRYYSEFSYTEIHEGYSFMKSELAVCFPGETSLKELFEEAWQAFEKDVFSYDGATFVQERNEATIFEVASFIHDYRNSLGYVGRRYDEEFIEIMIYLEYQFHHIFKRFLLMQLFTWLNVLRHKINNNYRKDVPINLFRLKQVFINP